MILKIRRNEGFRIILSIAHQKLAIPIELFRRLINIDGFLTCFLKHSFAMEDFSSTLLEDGQELGSSHGFLGKLISDEGFSLWIGVSGLLPAKRSR